MNLYIFYQLKANNKTVLSIKMNPKKKWVKKLLINKIKMSTFNRIKKSPKEQKVRIKIINVTFQYEKSIKQ